MPNQTAIELARNSIVSTLYKPRAYRPSKTTDIGMAGDKRETIIDLKGPGVFKRLWTTHKELLFIKIDIYVDGNSEPVLSGMAHELAQAAEKISTEQIPLGGYYNHGSVNLYIPISFKESFRIDAEPTGTITDGPYWQIDCALDCHEDLPLPLQSEVDGKPVITCESPAIQAEKEINPVRIVSEDISLKQVIPHTVWLEGGGVINKIVISGRDLDSLLLRISFDGVRGGKLSCEKDRMDAPFQVDAPLKYLVGQFNNSCVERLGTRAVIHFPMPYKVRAGIQLVCGMEYGEFNEAHSYNIEIHTTPTIPSPDEFNYFHARFNAERTNGYDDFECCATSGKGHFVGVNIFDTGHDHGGGDSICFDSGADSAGQLHGICGEDYFHMAYFAIWNLTPYSGCPNHSSRYRYHLEMPIPFKESFIFNWGSFASQPAKTVAFWYQDELASTEKHRDLTYTMTGPFPLEALDNIAPKMPFPETALVWPKSGWPTEDLEFPVQSWQKTAQHGFMDLCHMSRHYVWAAPFAAGNIPSNQCICAETHVWAARKSEILIRLGSDDPIRLYLNHELIFSDEGRIESDPFKLFKISTSLISGKNTLRVVAANLPNTNWKWAGFSLVIESDLSDDELLYMN